VACTYHPIYIGRVRRRIKVQVGLILNGETLFEKITKAGEGGMKENGGRE
jgi:hypothetical protein